MAHILKPRKSCYLCGAKPVSKEHVPARCFFPDDATYRKQLITVPSCKKHNEDTSIDDEYVRNIITTHHTNNHLAFKQFTEKVVGSLKQNVGMIGRGVKIETASGTQFAFEVDRDRFDKVLRKIAYALFFHEHKYQWHRELIVLTRNLVYPDLSPDDFGRFLASVEAKLPALAGTGDNPKIFHYTILTSGDKDEDVIIRMTFYEGFTVWVTTVTDSIAFKL